MKRGGPLKRYTRLRSVNPERRKAKKAEQFGPQAKLCLTLPCAACGHPGPSDPAHVRSRGAGGKDRANVIPLCKTNTRKGREGCHQQQHRLGWCSPTTLYPPQFVLSREWAEGYAAALALVAYGPLGEA